MTAEERVALAFVTDHPDDASRLLERADPGDAAAILASVPAPVAAHVYRGLGPSAAAACAAALTDDALAALIEALPLDVAAIAMRAVEPSRHHDVLARLGEERRDALRAALSYPENTAGALADPLVLALPQDISIADGQRHLRGSQRHLFYYVYVVARDRTLVGSLAMPELMGAHPTETVAAVMKRNLVRLDAHMSLATVAAHPAWHDFDALPVVDSAGRFIGAIRHKTIRQMSREPGRPMTATIVGLSELYWVGLAGILASFAPAQTRAMEDDDVS